MSVVQFGYKFEDSKRDVSRIRRVRTGKFRFKMCTEKTPRLFDDEEGTNGYDAKELCHTNKDKQGAQKLS